MTITFAEINRTGSIVLGKYMRGAEVLAYEARFPVEAGRTAYVRSPSLETASRAYWEAIARDLEQAA